MNIRKKRILSVFFAILLVVSFYLIFLKDRKVEFTLVEVVKGDIAREIFESGQVKRGENVNLALKNAGRIDQIYVAVGDEVEQGQKLAKLETADLEIQLKEAMLSLEMAELNLNKLLLGATEEEIKIAESQAETARASFVAAQENLNKTYQSAIIVFDASLSQIYNALDFAKEFVKKYVVTYDQDGRRIMQMRDAIDQSEKEARDSLDKAKIDQKEIKTTFLVMKNSLEQTFNSLKTIRQVVDGSSSYINSVSANDKASLDLLRTNTNTALANLISSEQGVSSAELNFKLTEARLQEAENYLSLIKTGARQIDIDLHQTQIKQAQARAQLYENQIKQSELISPTSGKVIEIRKRSGELVQPGFQDVVIVILPFMPYEIKTNIYEEDVVKIDLGNPVEISLVAFPGRTFKGSVVSINPAERLLDGVVYYETTIDFEENIEGLRPGMTADLVIEADLKENVLIIPRAAVQRKEGRTIVEIFKDGEIQEREIEVGARGNDDLVEIISGLREGEKVIIR